MLVTLNSDVCPLFGVSFSVISDIVRILMNAMAYLEVSKVLAFVLVETDCMARNIVSHVFYFKDQPFDLWGFLVVLVLVLEFGFVGWEPISLLDYR
jgi:hypothetical protein